MSHFEAYNKLFYREAIGRIGGRHVYKELTLDEYHVLISLLTHWKTRLRWSAADRLGKLGDSYAVEPLIKTLQDTHWLVRLHATKALGRIGELVAIEALVQIINDENPYVRRRVITALAQLNTNMNMQVTKILISALNDSDKGVRARAARGLGANASPLTIAAITTAVCDPDKNVSWRAIDTLQKIGVPAISDLLSLFFVPYQLNRETK